MKTSENDVKHSDFNMVEMDKSRELYSKEGDNSSRFEGKTVLWEHTIEPYFLSDFTVWLLINNCKYYKGAAKAIHIPYQQLNIHKLSEKYVSISGVLAVFGEKLWVKCTGQTD